MACSHRSTTAKHETMNRTVPPALLKKIEELEGQLFALDTSVEVGKVEVAEEEE